MLGFIPQDSSQKVLFLKIAPKKAYPYYPGPIHMLYFTRMKNQENPTVMIPTAKLNNVKEELREFSYAMVLMVKGTKSSLPPSMVQV